MVVHHTVIFVRQLAGGSLLVWNGSFWPLCEPRRVRIKEIIKTVSRHFGVSKADILSQRRHRSVVWPRQIGMYLSKQLTAHSLPEIGRRFGSRDHTAILDAIRKIDKELAANPRLRDELEDLKKMLSS